MKTIIITSVVFFLFVLSCDASNNGIAGLVKRYYDRKTLSSVVVEVKTQTDIREQMNKAHKTSKTDSAGQFEISGLIAGKGYQVRVKDPMYISDSNYVYVPEKGTRMLKNPLIACPLPPGGGIWIYEFSSSKFNRLKLENEKKVKIRVHAGLIGNRSVFSISDNDTNKICEEIEPDGLLIIFREDVKDIAQLYKIPNKTVSLGTEGTAQIKEGWYYNIRDFFGEDWWSDGRKRLAALGQTPLLENALNIKSNNIWAIPLRNFYSGLYILTTEITSGQRASVLSLTVLYI